MRPLSTYEAKQIEMLKRFKARAEQEAERLIKEEKARYQKAIESIEDAAKRGEAAPEEQVCPRRSEGPQVTEPPDAWEVSSNADGRRTCSYCGSWHPGDFMDWLAKNPEGKVEYAKSYKVYAYGAGIGGSQQKFYTQHLGQLSDPQYAREQIAARIKQGR